MSDITHYLCIGCPLGCRLEVEERDGDVIEVRGFGCKRGKEYAEREHHDPRRMLSTTVAIVGGLWPRLPVRTDAPIPKGQVLDVCRSLRRLVVQTPVRLGQVIVPNVLNSGANIVACRDMLGTDSSSASLPPAAGT